MHEGSASTYEGHGEMFRSQNNLTGYMHACTNVDIIRGMLMLLLSF